MAAFAPEAVIPMADKLLPSLNFLAPVRRSSLPNRSRRKALQEQFDRHIGEFLRTDRALGVVPGVGEVDDAEQDHRVDLLGPLDDSTLGVEPEQKFGDEIDQLPFKILDSLLLILVQE